MLAILALALALSIPHPQVPRVSKLSKYTTEALDDQITDLPGLTQQIGFSQFAGYLDLPNSKKHVFYWFVESVNNPETAPVVFWTNGGPGCSGLIGFFSEHGPFRVLANLTLDLDPYAWNLNANMLYVEQPAGVGFSYSDSTSDYRTGDAQAAKDNYALILQFLNKFPNFASNKLFLSAESYGGHYIPTLAQEIVKNDNGTINFKGFAIGNPLTNMNENAHGNFDTLYGHQVVSRPTYLKWQASCSSKDSSAECQSLEQQLAQEAGGLNPYAIDYPVCNDNVKRVGRAQRIWMLNHIHGAKPTAFKQALGLIPPSDYIPCEADYLTSYLNLAEVKKAIHARSDIEWGECSSVVDYSQADVQTDVVPVYKYLLSAKADLNMLIYSGDDDTVCGTIGSQSWIWGLDLKVKSAWKSWNYNDTQYGDQIGGYVVKFDKLTFATIHGAGHEVPTYRPAPAFELLSRFLSGDF